MNQFINRRIIDNLEKIQNYLLTDPQEQVLYTLYTLYILYILYIHKYNNILILNNNIHGSY